MTQTIKQKPVVAAIILKNKKLLLVQRAKKPAQNKWNIPGGRIKEDEKPERAIVREIKEEIGLETTLKFLYFSVDDLTENSINYPLQAYLCDYKKPLKLKKNKKEILNINFFSYTEAQNLNLTTPVRKILLPKLLRDGLIE